MQINRPLIWILASYLAGILLNGISKQFELIIICLSILIILMQMIHLYKKTSKLSSYYFLIFLPFFFILGLYLTNTQMKPSSMDTAFEEKMEVTLRGELIAIEEKGEYQRLTLKEVISDYKVDNVVKHITLRNKVLVYNSNISQFRLGNILKISGTLQKFQIASNPGQFNEYEYNRNKKFDYKINAKEITIEEADFNILYDTIYQLKLKFQNVYNSILDQKQSGILSAMILGDTNSLDQEVNQLYKQNGISHIIAISGLHVSLLGLTLFNLLRKLRIPMLPSTLASVFILYAYGILTGFSVSTNRSIVMLVIYMLSLLVGRTYDLLSSTALSAIIILIQNPMELFNAGFLLSFGAIVAVSTIFPILKKLIPIQNTLLHSLLMCIAIQFVTTPILLYYFYEIPTFSVFINLIIIPLSSLVILLAVIAVILGSLYLPLGVFFVGGAHFLLIFFEEVCKLALHLPFRRILTGRPDSITLLTYFLILSVFLLLNKRKVKKLSLILLLFTCVIFIKPISSELEINFLDVGQGDGVVINLPGNTTFLIDGGSTNISKIGKYRIETFLKYKGIGDIDYAIVTHTDKDHISGLQELMEAMDNKETKEEKVPMIDMEYEDNSSD
ncbi:MAG: putative rane protein, partial [Anaerocolumna sp.]|nr:putative rane protein [Anaerocolumna sp.]